MSILKISQLPIFSSPLQPGDVFPLSQLVGTPSSETRKVPWGNILSQIQGTIAPLTTKGDLLGFSTQAARIPVGEDYSILQCDSSAGVGVSWTNSPNLGGLTVNSDTQVNINAKNIAFSTPAGYDISFNSRNFDVTTDGSIGGRARFNGSFEIDGDSDNYINITTGNVSANILNGIFGVNSDIGTQIIGSTITERAPGSRGAITFGYNNNFDCALLASFDIEQPFPQPARPFAISPHGGNVSMGLQQGWPSSLIFDEPFHLFGNQAIDADTFPQFKIRAFSNTEQRIYLGYNTDDNCAGMQAYKDFATVDEADFYLNYDGGKLGVNMPMATPLTETLTVGGNISSSGYVKAAAAYLGGVSPNIYAGTQAANSLLVVNPSTPAQQAILAWDSTNQITYLQSIIHGVSFRPIIFNPSGGASGFGYAANHTFTRNFEVAGNALFDSNVLFNNGITITEAGGGIQFNNSGPMTVNDGVSFYAGNQYYRIGFDDNGGGVGWLRSNIDIANSVHGFVWSAGLVTNPINALMYLRGDGRLMLASTATTKTFQSLANVYGDLFLGQLGTPSVPTAGMKVYAKSDGKLYALNSSGVEYDLTNSGAGSVTSVFSRTGNVVGVSTDYATVTQFTAKSFLAQMDGTYNGAGYQFMVKGDSQPGYQLWMGYDTTDAYGYIQAVDISGSPTGAPLLLNPNFAGSSAAGNVGINTNMPTAQLHVIGGSIFDKGASSLGLTSIGETRIVADGTMVSDTPQVRITGATTPSYEMQIGYDTTNNYGYILSKQSGVALTKLWVQPAGGDVVIGNGNTSGRVTIGASSSFVLPGDMAIGDCNITRSGTGPYSLLFRVKCDDGFVYVGTLNLL